MDSPLRDLPLGFGLTLLQDQQATQSFYAMPPEQRSAILQKAHAVTSKSEMQALVSSLRTLGQGPGPMQRGEVQ